MIVDVVALCLMVLLLWVQLAAGATWGNEGGLDQAEWTDKGEWKYPKGWWKYRRKDYPITYWLIIAIQVGFVVALLIYMIS